MLLDSEKIFVSFDWIFNFHSKLFFYIAKINNIFEIIL